MKNTYMFARCQGWISVRRLGALALPFFCSAIVTSAAMVEISDEKLRDKIRGGMLGQILGNLNGLPHEFKYNADPGKVTGYIPALKEGAWTDDDTDFEWVYVLEMQKRNQILLPIPEITQLWRERVNARIWCANQYARQLMDLDLEPPLTGNVILNPWADFNLSGQFLCETFGLIAPAMPQTASRIGLHYTRVAIDGEPAQTTQLFDTMIATAFQTNDVPAIIEAGLAAVDPASLTRQIVKDVMAWHREAPDDWLATRSKIKTKYLRHHGEFRDANGFELNTACIIAALLHGRGDFAKSLELAFNLGWDCDCNAATVGTILGVVRGYRWMLAQEWLIVDRYRNTCREQMPMDETITSYADRLVELAEKVIIENGGKRTIRNGRPVFEIKAEAPQNVAPVPDLAAEGQRIQREFGPGIRTGLDSQDAKVRARSAYLAICLGMDEELRRDSAARWKAAVEDLGKYDRILQVMFHHSSVPSGVALQKRALRAGLIRPPQKRELW